MEVRLTAEQRKALQQYEKWLHQVHFSNYCSAGLMHSEIEEIQGIYEAATGIKMNVHLSCLDCIWHNLLVPVARLYYTEDEEPKEVKPRRKKK